MQHNPDKIVKQRDYAVPGTIPNHSSVNRVELQRYKMSRFEYKEALRLGHVPQHELPLLRPSPLLVVNPELSQDLVTVSHLDVSYCSNKEGEHKAANGAATHSGSQVECKGKKVSCTCCEHFVCFRRSSFKNIEDSASRSR